MPELLPIHRAQDKTFRQIHNEISAAQQRPGDSPAGPSTTDRLTRFMPSSLPRAAVRAATRSVAEARQSGVMTAVRMHGPGPGWGFPLSVWTVAVTVGGIGRRPVLSDGSLEARKYLCPTTSFDHDIVDGAPAVRFMSRFAALFRSSGLLREGISTEVE